jgi:hypothetical protein
LREALMPLPFKEPSATLLNLLGMLVDAGRRFASIGDMQVGDGNAEAPVGTTVALLERGSRVMSAIHKRLHYSQRIEFNLLAGLFRDYLPPQYPYMTANGDQSVKQSDFDDRIDIIPVSDPNIFSMSQRVMLAQEMLRMVQAAPEIHGPMGMYNAYKRMYEAMGIQQVDQILPPPPPPPEPQPVAAAIENAGFLAMQPATPFPDQDHMAHISIHMSFYNSAVCQANPQIQGLVMAHVYAHIDMMARNQAQQDPEIMQMQQQMQMMQQQQQQMPGPPGMPGMSPQQMPGMPPQQPNPQMQQMQKQMQGMMETKVAQITAQLVDQIAPAFEPKQDEDPLVGLRREELNIKAADVERKAEEADKRLDLDQERIDTQRKLSEERNDIQVDIAEMKDQTAQDRLKLQQAVQMGNLAEKMTKNFFGN